MRYIVTLFWAVVLGQVVGYIGAALTSGTYDFTLTTIISLIAGVIILLRQEKKPLPIRKKPAKSLRYLKLFFISNFHHYYNLLRRTLRKLNRERRIFDRTNKLVTIKTAL